MIPKIIHQIWVGDIPVPKREALFAEKVKHAHPYYSYMYWTTTNAAVEVLEMPENFRDW